MWVVALTSHLPRHVSACWIFDDEHAAQQFAAFVTAEIDPAVVLRALNPVNELLSWREQFAARKDQS
jgi:hypothetical protein